MEIIKDLPEVFEEFAEQRKNSFLGVKKLKDAGVPVIGSYCTYFPQEIATAMGAASVSLCSTSDETIPEAEKDLPKNLWDHQTLSGLGVSRFLCGRGLNAAQYGVRAPVGTTPPRLCRREGKPDHYAENLQRVKEKPRN